jgi:hypothetical protein
MMAVYVNIMDGGLSPSPPTGITGAARIHTYHVAARADDGWRHTQALHFADTPSDSELMAAVHRMLANLGKAKEFVRE